MVYVGTLFARITFKLSDEHRTIRRAVHDFGENEIEPVAREHDERGEHPHDLIEQAARYDLVAPNVPEEYGGREWTRSRVRSSPRNSGEPIPAPAARSALVGSARP